MAFSVVRGLSRARVQGKLDLGYVQFPCALGRSGRGPKSHEGDGMTPIGRWLVRHVLYRPDRIARPRTALPVAPLAPDLGWCDETGDANYNRLVRLPYRASHERLWRQDHLYDLIVVLGYNDIPRSQGRGSAIFMHLARPSYRPTAGCVALALPHLQQVVARLRPGDRLIIE
jgi:L,D-peptidoglycan transpeptidase YkuD (ErfK/YbiS/YcfS/YnhG family)